MKRFRDYLHDLGMKRMYFIALIFGIGLLVAGFLCPPLSVIDKSVLIAVAEIIIFVDLPIVVAIVAGNSMKVALDLDDKKIEIDSKDEHTD